MSAGAPDAQAPDAQAPGFPAPAFPAADVQTPDAEDLARSMLVLHGAHDDEGHGSGDSEAGPWSKAPNFASDPVRAAAVRESSRRDRERYLSAGLAAVDCRFCHVSVMVKKLGAAHTAVQWSTEAQQRCADDLGDAEPAPARGQQRQHQHQHAERGGQVAVHLLAPGLVGLERTDLAGRMRGRVPNCRTASSTPWRKGASRSTRAPPPPATADPLREQSLRYPKSLVSRSFCVCSRVKAQRSGTSPDPR